MTTPDQAYQSMVANLKTAHRRPIGDESDTLEEGESLRVPMAMMDTQQRALAEQEAAHFGTDRQAEAEHHRAVNDRVQAHADHHGHQRKQAYADSAYGAMCADLETAYTEGKQ